MSKASELLDLIESYSGDHPVAKKIQKHLIDWAKKQGDTNVKPNDQVHNPVGIMSKKFHLLAEYIPDFSLEGFGLGVGEIPVVYVSDWTTSKGKGFTAEIMAAIKKSAPRGTAIVLDSDISGGVWKHQAKKFGIKYYKLT